MKKIVAIVFCIVISINYIKAQNAYYDAIKIDRFLRDDRVDTALQTYLPYFVRSNGQVDYSNFFSLIDSNQQQQINNYLLGASDIVSSLCKNILPDSVKYNRDSSRVVKRLCPECNSLQHAKNQLEILPKLLVEINQQIDSLLHAGNINDELIRTRVITDSLLNSGVVSDSLMMVSAASSLSTDALNALKTQIDSSLAEDVTRKKTLEDDISINTKEMVRIQAWFRDNFNYTLGSIFNAIVSKTFPKKPDRVFTIPQKKGFDVSLITKQEEEVRNTAIMRNETSGLSNFKIPSQSEIIDALAIYIARRFKQEVAITLVATLRKALNKQPLLGQLFPETIKLFNNGEDYEMPRFGKMWNHAISEDFIRLPDNICSSDFIEKRAAASNTINEYNIFRDIVKISTLVIEKNTLPEIVSLYKADNELIRSKDIKGCFEMLNMVNNEMFDASSDAGQYWISWKQLQEMTASQYAIFLTLLEGKYAPVFMVSKPSEWKGSLSGKLILYKRYLVKSLLVLNNLQKSQNEYLNRLTKDPNSIYTGTNFWDYQKSIFSSFYNQEFISVSNANNSSLQLFEKGAEIYKLLETKQYAAMVHESMSVLETLIPAPSNRFNELLVKTWKLDKKKYEDLQLDFNSRIDVLQYNLQRDLDTLRQTCKSKNDSLNLDCIKNTVAYKIYDSLASNRSYEGLLTLKTKEQFAKFLLADLNNVSVERAIQSAVSKSRFLYVTKSAELFTDIMSAGNSKELASVIEAYSMPPNSYKIKRSSRFSVDINAYVGAYGGLESIKVNDTINNKTSHSVKAVYGISVPLGITFSWGSRRESNSPSSNSFLTKKGSIKELKGNCFSLSVNIIDITAPVVYRLEKGENIALPKQLKWAQILSPGLHARWGIRNTPLNLSTGIQYTPQMRNLDGPEDMQQAVRLYAGVFFDLPLFNVYRR